MEILEVLSFPGFVIGLLLGGWAGWALGIREPFFLGLLALAGAGFGSLLQYWVGRRFFPAPTAVEKEDKGIRWDA